MRIVQRNGSIFLLDSIEIKENKETAQTYRRQRVIQSKKKKYDITTADNSASVGFARGTIF